MVWTLDLLWWHRYLWIFSNVASFNTEWRELTHHLEERMDCLWMPQLCFWLHLIIADSFWHWSVFFLACSSLLTVTVSASISLSLFKSIPKNIFFREKKNSMPVSSDYSLPFRNPSSFWNLSKIFFSVSLQHTSLKDLVGFNIPLAAVVFKFIFNIMSCLSGNAN